VFANTIKWVRACIDARGIVWVALRLVGGLFVSLFCIRQTDLKSLIAYSSVAHISMVIGGIMTQLLRGL
jgi:NADH-ubiquinone oxidoreductase chain 4